MPLGWIGTVWGLKQHFSLNCLVPPGLQQRILFCLFPVIITRPFVQDSSFVVWVLTSPMFVYCYLCCHSPPFRLLLVQPCFHSSRCGTAGTFSLFFCLEINKSKMCLKIKLKKSLFMVCYVGLHYLVLLFLCMYVWKCMYHLKCIYKMCTCYCVCVTVCAAFANAYMCTHTHTFVPRLSSNNHPDI